jgi:tRNA modification GTPase
MASADVIAAIATAPGRAGIGVVRVSGSNLKPLAQALLGKVPLPRQAALTRFLGASGEILDQGLALYFPAPKSYTGEDVLELHGHGGPAVLLLLLRRCLALGARLAEPGEFTKRAFLNDKLDLAQAESVADLIDATTAEAAKSAMRSLQGAFSTEVNALTYALRELRTLV